MRRITTLAVLTVVAVSGVVSLDAQAREQPAGATPRFSVVSVKRGQASQPATAPMSLPGGTFEMENLPIRNLVTFAYRRRANEIFELPKWATTEVFTIRAKADASATPEQIRAMVRTVLAERFQMVAHEETRPVQMWVMTVARKDGKLGSSLVRRTEPCKPGTTVTVRSRTVKCPGFVSWSGGLAIVGMPMAVVAELIGNLFLDLKVVNRTGLEGLYDASFDSAARADGAPANDVRLPLLFPAIEEQLGLKLELQREPTPVTVIDRLEQPTED